jgi:hypothetical protein
MNRHRFLNIAVIKSAPLAVLSTFLMVGAIQIHQVAAEDQVPAPQPPFVAPVPDKAQWTISLDPKKTGASSSGSSQETKGSSRGLTEIISTKSGPLKQDIQVFADGKKIEFWYVGNVVLIPASNNRDILSLDDQALIPTAEHNPGMNAADLEIGNLIQSRGFPGLGWLKLKYYTGVVTVAKTQCYHFALPDPATSNPAAEAWIEVKTKLPVAYMARGTVYTFHFGDPPTAPLSLPPAYASTLDRAQRMADHIRQLNEAAGTR